MVENDPFYKQKALTDFPFQFTKAFIQLLF